MVDSARTERVLALTRAHYHATPAARARVRAGLEARGELTHPASGRSLLARWRAAGIAKSTAALLAGVSFIAGFWLGEQRVSERAPDPSALSSTPSATRAASSLAPVPSVETAPSVAPEMAASAPPAEPRTALQGSAPEVEAMDTPTSVATRTNVGSQRPHASHHGSRVTPARAESDGVLNAELALLQRAERAIRSGEADLALSFLDDLDRRYPDTPFVEERTAARLMARCARNEPGAAVQAEVFLRERRTSVYSDRVCALCQIEGARDGNPRAGH